MKIVKLLCPLLILTIASISLGAQLQFRYDNEHRMALEHQIHEKDSIISSLSDYILTVTYQHEDDDALMEEELP